VKYDLTADDVETPFLTLRQRGIPFFRNIQDFFASDADEMMMARNDGIESLFGGIPLNLNDLSPFPESFERVVYGGQGKCWELPAKGRMDFLR